MEIVFSNSGGERVPDVDCRDTPLRVTRGPPGGTLQTRVTTRRDSHDGAQLMRSAAGGTAGEEKIS